MAHVEIEVIEVTGEAAVQSPRRRSLLASLERALGLLVEIPAAILVVAEILILFAGVVAHFIGAPSTVRCASTQRSRSSLSVDWESLQYFSTLSTSPPDPFC